jgi:hypothetical protein
MVRPEIDDEHIEKMEEIIDNSVAVPLPADELSTNQMFRIIIDQIYSEYQQAENPKLVIDNEHVGE